MNTMMNRPLLKNEANENSELNRPYEMSTTRSFRDILQIRYLVILLLCFATFCTYATRVCLSMAMVCMVNHTAILQNSVESWNETNKTIVVGQCRASEMFGNGSNNFPNEDGQFIWDEELQGIILSSFFWGYAFLQLPGGIFSDKLGGKWIMGFSVLASSLLAMVIPSAAKVSPNLVIASRIVSGLTQGVFFPALYSISSKWAPKQERSRFVTLAIIGIGLGTGAVYLVSAALCQSQILGGWSGIFYLLGIVGVLWFILWCFLMYETPSKHPWITPAELRYIEENTFCKANRSQMKIPWGRILRSPPVLVICVTTFCAGFKFAMMLTQLPTYFKVILGFSIEQNGYISILPSLAGLIVALLASWIADLLINRQAFSIGCVRKSLFIMDAIITTICFIGISHLECDRMWIVILIWIGVSIDGVTTSSFEINGMDLSPNFSGVIKGIQNSCGALAGVAAPYMVGKLTKNNNTKSSWDTAFYIAMGLNLFGALCFLAFGSGDVQPWNDCSQAQQLEDDDKEDVVYEKSKLINGSKAL